MCILLVRYEKNEKSAQTLTLLVTRLRLRTVLGPDERDAWSNDQITKARHRRVRPFSPLKGLTCTPFLFHGKGCLDIKRGEPKQ